MKNGKTAAARTDSSNQPLSDEILDRLRRAESQLENLTRHWPGILFSQRPDFSFAFISPRIEEWTGITAAQFAADTTQFWRAVHEEDRDRLQNRLKARRTSADSTEDTFRVRNLLTGRVSHVWERRQAVLEGNGELLRYEGMWLDVTRQTMAERRLMQMAWRENVGTLATGIVHDFSNLMTGIIAVSETLENEFAQNTSLCSRLAMIRNGAMQANELAQRIRSFQSSSAGEKNYQDLNQIAAQTEALLQKMIARRVKLETKLCDGQLPVHVDAVELRQAIIYLALNGADAMPDGGTLTLRTSRHEHPPAGLPSRGAFPRGPLACISVCDTGAGIPVEFRDSIFDPYFTTKPVGKGAGLGLRCVELFAERHGAAITMETAPGAGTVFHLWLAQSNLSEAEQTQSGCPVRHTLLVAGASAESRAKLIELLRANDFFAADAASSSDALKKIHSPEYEFSALLLLADAPNEADLLLLRQIRAGKLPVKTFLCPTGSADEFNTGFLVNVNATLPPPANAPEWIRQLRKCLSQT